MSAPLAEQYSAADKSTQFKTTGGSYINISVTQEGQSVDASALYDDMLECLKNKTGGTRTAPLYRGQRQQRRLLGRQLCGDRSDQPAPVAV